MPLAISWVVLPAEPLPENIAAAMNEGLRAADTPLVGFSFDASFPRAEVSLRACLEAFADERVAGVCAGGAWEGTGVGRWRPVEPGSPPRSREVGALPCMGALYRRRALEEIGGFDEDFVAHGHEIDAGVRLRARGGRLLQLPIPADPATFCAAEPDAVVAFFRGRSRLLLLAKHAPDELPGAVAETPPTQGLCGADIYEALLCALPKLFAHPAPVVGAVAPALRDALLARFGPWATDRLLARLQAILGHRRVTLGIYDHALHAIGGGQRYAATLAAAVQDDLEVTFLVNKPVRRETVEGWYRLDLSRCEVRHVPLAYYERRRLDWIDSSRIRADMPNPFDAVARASAEYDLFLNANMLEKVRPLSPISVFLCHFPDVLPRSHFAVHEYDFVIANARYTVQWLRRRWNLEATWLLHPPVDMEAPPAPKEKLILSVARFELGGSKKQLELVRAFRTLRRLYPRALEGWKLALVGGSLPRNAYLRRVEELVREGDDPIELHPNAPIDAVRRFYARAALFWHACGLGETEPQLIEHFGMTTVEAMQNGCVPIVIGAGGQLEIVEHGRSGLLFASLDELCAETLELIEDASLLERLRAGALERSRHFSRPAFEERVRVLFGAMRRAYTQPPRPALSEIADRFSKEWRTPRR